MPANGAGTEGDGARPAPFAGDRARFVSSGMQTYVIGPSVASFAQAAGRSRTRGLAAVACRSGNAAISPPLPDPVGAARCADNCWSTTNGMLLRQLATFSAGSAHGLRENAELVVSGALACYSY